MICNAAPQDIVVLLKLALTGEKRPPYLRAIPTSADGWRFLHLWRN
jgi:hypothetical protein